MRISACTHYNTPVINFIFSFRFRHFLRGGCGLLLLLLLASGQQEHLSRTAGPLGAVLSPADVAPPNKGSISICTRLPRGQASRSFILKIARCLNRTSSCCCSSSRSSTSSSSFSSSSVDSLQLGWNKQTHVDTAEHRRSCAISIVVFVTL